MPSYSIPMNASPSLIHQVVKILRKHKECVKAKAQVQEDSFTVAQREHVHHLSSITVEHIWQVQVLGLETGAAAGLGLDFVVLDVPAEGVSSKKKVSAGLSLVQASQQR